jgi:hypothetical protein
MRIFVDDDEVAIGKGGNGGIGLRSGHPTGTAVFAEIDLLLAERGKSGAHCRLPDLRSERSAGSKELGVERYWR